MPYLIRIIDVVGRVTHTNIAPPLMRGQFIKSADVNTFNGGGDVEATRDPLQARRFATTEAAIAFYRQVSRMHPRRPDGRPNRPLTALSVELVELTLPQPPSAVPQETMVEKQMRALLDEGRYKETQA